MRGLFPLRSLVFHLAVLAALSSIAAAPAAGGERDESLCLMIESAARAHDLPVAFFARVIWQESRFRADAVGPPTRGGKRAQGMAQFMPGTAAERGLLDPFDPVQALPKSAEFLKELWMEFGNPGLAAAAYNAGPRRVREWLDGTGHMPDETRNYVSAITGLTVEDWKQRRGKPARAATPPGAAAGMADCAQMMAMLRRTPSEFLDRLEQRVTVVSASAWGVQLAAGFSRARVMSIYARLLSRFGAVLKGRDPSILTSLSRSRGTRTFYQVRLGADTRKAADALCGEIRRAGGSCIVLRNRPSRA